MSVGLFSYFLGVSVVKAFMYIFYYLNVFHFKTRVKLNLKSWYCRPWSCFQFSPYQGSELCARMDFLIAVHEHDSYYYTSLSETEKLNLCSIFLIWHSTVLLQRPAFLLMVKHCTVCWKKVTWGVFYFYRLVEALF